MINVINLVQELNLCGSVHFQDKKSFNYEHLNFSGKELNVTDITEQ